MHFQLHLEHETLRNMITQETYFRIYTFKTINFLTSPFKYDRVYHKFIIFWLVVRPSAPIIVHLIPVKVLFFIVFIMHAIEICNKKIIQMCNKMSLERLLGFDFKTYQLLHHTNWGQFPSLTRAIKI